VGALCCVVLSRFNIHLKLSTSAEWRLFQVKTLLLIKVDTLHSVELRSFSLNHSHVHMTKAFCPSLKWAVLLSIWSFQMNKFLKDESGATAIEYGLIAAAMGLALVTAMPFITRAVVTKFTTLGTQITTPIT
jgi:pilus assembly protein Flp/PilA